MGAVRAAYIGRRRLRWSLALVAQSELPTGCDCATLCRSPQGRSPSAPKVPVRHTTARQPRHEDGAPDRLRAQLLEHCLRRQSAGGCLHLPPISLNSSVLPWPAMNEKVQSFPRPGGTRSLSTTRRPGTSTPPKGLRVGQLGNASELLARGLTFMGSSHRLVGQLPETLEVLRDQAIPVYRDQIVALESSAAMVRRHRLR